MQNIVNKTVGVISHFIESKKLHFFFHMFQLLRIYFVEFCVCFLISVS